MSDSSPPRSRRRAIARRLLLFAAFVTAGFVAVWQGFGLLGFGTEDHPQRNLATLAPLAVGGAVLGSRRSFFIRAAAVLFGLAFAAGAWWLVPCRDGGMSLNEAVYQRYRLTVHIDALSPEDIDSGIATKLNVDRLQSQYGTLGLPLRGRLQRWSYSAAEDSAARFRRIPLDDPAAARALEEQVRKLAVHFPEAGMRVGQAIDTWIARAVLYRQHELEKLPSGDWLAFDQTAPGRLALAEIGVASFALITREELAKAEEEWVNESVEALVEQQSMRNEGADQVRADVWRAIEKDILALKSLDTSDDRFKAARRRLFDLAYASTLAETGRLIKAGRHNAAWGVARRYAVEWNATAGVLGARDVKKLDALREKCAALVKPGVADPDPADEDNIAPPPRAKPAN